MTTSSHDDPGPSVIATKECFYFGDRVPISDAGPTEKN